MKFTKIPKETFDELQINAGILLKDFDTETGTFDDEDMITATTGGITVNVKPTYEDFGSDIDNCPKNTMELKRITETEVSIATTALNINEDLLLFQLGAADKDQDTGAIKPRRDLKLSDFSTLWWVGDMSDNGFIAVKISNALSTDGFSIKTSDKGKGNISITLTGHVSMDAQDVIPAEFYLGEGEPDTEGVYIKLNRQAVTMAAGATKEISATYTEGATVAWESTDTSVATVSNGTITAVDAGVCVITAKATKDGQAAIASCDVTIEANGEG